jgi:plasmid maintenance system antidote protein VapI
MDEFEETGMPSTASREPRVILMEEFLERQMLTARDLAGGSGIKHDLVAAILSGQQSVPSEACTRLDSFFGMEPGFFAQLHAEHDALKAGADPDTSP